MSMPSQKIKMLLLTPLAACGVAAACEMMSLPDPITVNISWSTLAGGGAAIHQAIGNSLQALYGNTFNAYEVFVPNVLYRSPAGGIGSVPFTKPCGDSFSLAGADYETIE